MNVVGRPLPRVDGMAKVTGAATYADDLSLPRMLSCRICAALIPTPGSSASIRARRSASRA